MLQSLVESNNIWDSIKIHYQIKKQWVVTELARICNGKDSTEDLFWKWTMLILRECEYHDILFLKNLIYRVPRALCWVNLVLVFYYQEFYIKIIFTSKGNRAMDLLVYLNISIFNIGDDIDLSIFMCCLN